MRKFLVTVLLAVAFAVPAKAKEFKDAAAIPDGYGVAVVRVVAAPNIGLTFDRYSTERTSTLKLLGSLFKFDRHLGARSGEGYVVRLIPAGTYQWDKITRGAQYAYAFAPEFTIKPQTVNYLGDLYVFSTQTKVGLSYDDAPDAAREYLLLKYPQLMSKFSFESSFKYLLLKKFDPAKVGM